MNPLRFGLFICLCLMLAACSRTPAASQLRSSELLEMVHAWDATTPKVNQYINKMLLARKALNEVPENALLRNFLGVQLADVAIYLDHATPADRARVISQLPRIGSEDLAGQRGWLLLMAQDHFLVILGVKEAYMLGESLEKSLEFSTPELQTAVRRNLKTLMQVQDKLKHGDSDWESVNFAVIWPAS